MKRSQLLVLVIVNMVAPLSIQAAPTSKTKEFVSVLPQESELGRASGSPTALELGWRAYQQGDLSAALKSYQTATESNPQDATLWYDLGCLYALTQQTDQAHAVFEKVLTLNPQFAAAQDALGQLHELQGDTSTAKTFYISAVELEPLSKKFLRHLARILLQLREEEPARRALADLLNTDPSDSNARYQLGVLELRANATELAVNDFHKALELAPNHLLAWNGLALAYARIGAFREAAEAIDKAKALNPNSAATATNLGIIAAYQQRWDEAKSAWEQALKLDPQFAPAARNLESLTAPSTP